MELYLFKVLEVIYLPPARIRVKRELAGLALSLDQFNKE
jgi:hypothetical protein